MFTNETPLHYRNEFARTDALVRPHVATLDDGFTYIAGTCPVAISNLYGNLLSVGYANGWIK